MPIRSPARAQAVTERVAARYRLTVDHVLCARWDRYARHARAEIAHALQADQQWSERAIARWLGCSKTGVRSLLDDHKRRHASNALDPAIELSALVTVSRDDQARRLAEAQQRIADLARDLDRLSGVHTAEMFADAYGLPVRAAIVLAILAEHYPRAALSPAMLQSYDHACAVLGYGRQNGATLDLMKKNTSTLNRAFRDAGMPEPVQPGELPGSRRLTPPVAALLAERFGIPRQSQIMLAREIVPAPFLGAAA